MKENGQQIGIDEVRKHFVDPSNPESASDLAQLGAEAIRVMAQIYSTGGDISKMSPEMRIWLESSLKSNERGLKEVVGKVLAKEADTRRFDSRFMGQIHPQGNKVGILANLIAAYMNTNTIVKEVSLAEHQMEHEVTEWLAEMFGYNPERASGNITTGGTTANIAALWAARQKKIKQWRQEKKGPLRKKLIVLTNEMTHYSVDKAAELLGVSLAKLPTDGYKTDVNRLDEILAKMSEEKRSRVMAIVCAAGETETGFVDDLNTIADIAEKYGIFLHVDAAYGGPFVLSKAGWRFKGIERADSITVDPHKMLYTPYAAGAILFRDKKDHALIQKCARYLQPESNDGLFGNPEERNFGFAARVEGSMGAGGVISTWATWKLLGEEGLAAVLNHTLDLAEHARKRISSSFFLQPIHKPELNTMLVGLNPNLNKTGEEYDQILKKARDEIDKKWDAYISHNGGVDNGRSALRFIAVHPYTTPAEVNDLFRDLEYEISKILDS